MFGFGRDKRQKKLDELLTLFHRAGDDAKIDFLTRLGGAATFVVKEFSKNLAPFSDFKTALTSEEAKIVAGKISDIEDSLQRSIKQGDGDILSVDVLAFRMLEVSLRHRAGEEWVTAEQSELVDTTIAAAEQTFNITTPGESDTCGGKEGADLDPFDVSLREVTKLVGELSFDITMYGTTIALLSLKSGYSPAETASHIALATFALDARELSNRPDILKMNLLFNHAVEVVEKITKFRDGGLMRTEIWRNDRNAMLKVTYPSEEQKAWTANILSDPIISEDRLAVSRVK